MLMAGFGYDAVKLMIVGALGGIVLVSALVPILVFSMPVFYQIVRPYIYMLLIFIALLMILSESGKKKIAASAFFLAAGFIGIESSRLPIDSTMLLFPILAGFFGVSMLMM